MRRKMLASPFRLEHYRMLLVNLLARGDVEFITYADLAWQEEDDHRTGYKNEWNAWLNDVRRGRLSSSVVYVLIQHDIDSGPQQTIEMLNLESEYGIVSTTMVFNKWRGESAVGEIVDFPADFEAMQSLETHGFVFGYHCNAFHNAGFRRESVFDEFASDVISLRRKLNVKFFSPHGGHTVNGVGNASFDYVDGTDTDLKHVHNRFSPRFASTFTDGGLLARLPNSGDALNPFAWANSLKAGRRYRLLLHPQYYSDENFKPLIGTSCGWYEDLIRQCCCC